MRIDNILQDHTNKNRYVSVIVNLDGTCEVRTDAGKPRVTFPNEQAMHDHFEGLPVNLIVRKIIQPRPTINHT